jgi:hypothetical protein
VFFDVENITLVMEIEFAKVLKNLRESNFTVGQVETKINTEPTIAVSAKGSPCKFHLHMNRSIKPVTCLSSTSH